MEHTPGPFVVGIGASAGGLDPYKKFFAAMPADRGIAFVLIPHLDPNHASLMVEILSRICKMPVVEAQDIQTVRANHVYIIPPNKYMTFSGGSLRLTGPVLRSGPQTSIDLFLRTLAEDKREKAICIILSGTGSHGSLGLKAIKASFGLTLVQDPRTAEYPSMPQSAVNTGLADFVLPVEAMPDVLIQYVQQGTDNVLTSDGVASSDPALMDQILTLLHARAQFDFRCYRKRMLERRIERRMNLNHLHHLADYLTLLRDHPEEAKLLSRDLLISVTAFFRDAEAFEVLKSDVIIPLVRDLRSDVPIRAWCAGCATGEEAYSIAILLMEQLLNAKKVGKVQIFATDVDDEALELARLGHYPENIATDVSPERLGQYFTHADNAYRVNKQLRELVIFARQNLMTDAPFSKLNLVVCRNVLIYLEPDVQKQVLSLLHYSLNDGGYLFLGPSETIGRQTDLFETISKKWRIYRRIGASRAARVIVPITASLPPLVPARRAPSIPSIRSVNYAELANRLLLEQFAPPSVLINRKCEILFYFGATDRFLTPPAGAPTQDVLMMAREGLRAKLRSGILHADRTRDPVTMVNARMKHSGEFLPVTVTIIPIPRPHDPDGLLLVSFQITDHSPIPLRRSDAIAEESVVTHLEQELLAIKEDLQNARIERESSNEELKVSNEEIMSINEELQSANEELETSKEELQSLNEELTTVNNQLQDKVTDLEKANNDMANLLNCSDVAILFLDNEFRIKRFTAPATRLFNLKTSDIERSIRDFTPKFTDPTLIQDMERVLKTLKPCEKPIQSLDGSWWSRQITLYRTMDNQLEGVILTFTDITPHKVAALQSQRLAAILMDSNDAVTVHDFDGAITAWNHGAGQMLGYREGEAIGMNVKQMIPAKSLNEIRYYWEPIRKGESVHSWESQRLTRDGRILDVWVTATALKDDTGKPVAMAKTERDITERKELEREVVEIASLEQRRIGQDLHDSVGQELTALNLLAGDLAESQRTKGAPEPKWVAPMVRGLQRCQTELRAIIQGLIPVAVDSEGLMAALSDLADRVQQEGKILCQFDCPQPVTLADNSTATQLYLIAQEAVHNAIKHARPQTIQITLLADDHLILRVQDDGVGMSVLPFESHAGLGQRIMRHRAAIIGATLSIHSAQPHGTLVECVVARVNHDSKTE